MPALSVIIPLAPHETAWKNLLAGLNNLPKNTEVLFIGSQDQDIDQALTRSLDQNMRFLESKPGRATQMNKGAQAAKGNFLWFLHADSQLTRQTLPDLTTSINEYPDSLLYFDLAFLNDASRLMCINQWGVFFRSRILKTPFGDQGFCIKKTLFDCLGGFPDHVPYGEDHLFVWTARQHGVKIQPVGATLYTSARKYQQHGWLRTTIMHQYLWIKQAWSQWKELKKSQKT